MKFGPFLLLMAMGSFVVYKQVARWVWNINRWLLQWGVLYFGGGRQGARLVGWFTFRHMMGGMDEVGKQLVAVGVAAVFGFTVKHVTATVIRKTIVWRVSAEDEDEGLDLTEPDKRGYHQSQRVGS